MKPSAAAIIPAAGSGTRMKLGQPKQYLLLAGVPMLVHTARAFINHPDIGRTIVVVPADKLAETGEIFRRYNLDGLELTVTAGGKRRQDSVFAGLQLLDQTTDIVLVHDGARPLVSGELISRCCEAAAEHGAAIAAIKVKDTIKKTDHNNRVTQTIDRGSLWQAQTPQSARRTLFQQAFAKYGDRDVTDESMLFELSGIKVTVVDGEETNIKITHPEDLQLAENIMHQADNVMRIGHGYDAHQLIDGRKLVLGGVTIEYHLGLAGHSDADVVSHAVCDALLGALGAGDIGKHFPDSDDTYKDIYSITLLEQVMQKVLAQGLRLANIDITIICEAPRLAPHLDTMKEILATAMSTAPTQVNIKATTTEGLGFAGRGEGIGCHAVALLQ